MGQAFSNVRAVMRLCRLAVHVGRGMATAAWVLPRCGEGERARHVQRWSAGVLRYLGVSLRVEGAVAPTTQLIVANHVSWLDIMVLHSVAPRARFVAKAEVQRWPVAGRLATAAGTLYVERQSRSSVRSAAPRLAQAFAGGGLVALFPEGTTTRGASVLDFHASLLQPAIDAGIPIQALSLRYAGASGQLCRAAAYIDDDTLLDSIWRLAKETDASVSLRVCPPLLAAGSRRDLALQLHALVAGSLQA